MLKAKLGDVTRAGGLGGLERGIAALLDPLAPSAPLREFLCLPSTERRLLTYLLVLHRSLRRNKSLGFGLSVIARVVHGILHCDRFHLSTPKEVGFSRILAVIPPKDQYPSFQHVLSKLA